MSISANRSASCAGAISVSQECSLISVPPDSSQTTRDEVNPANDDGANADITIEPCGTSLSSDEARPPAIKFRCVRGTAKAIGGQVE
jgi:hypothetical protein